MRSRKVHYQTNRKPLLMVGNVIFWSSLLLLVFGMFLSTRLTTSSPSPLPLAAFVVLFQPLLLILCVVGGFILGMANTKIVTSSEGVELHQLGFCTKSLWSNVARIAPFQSGNVSTEALYFRQPAKQFLKFLPFVPITSLDKIPLYLFRFDADSELGSALRLNKPDLFN